MWTPAILHIMSYFRSFKLNKHQKPLWKQTSPPRMISPLTTLWDLIRFCWKRVKYRYHCTLLALFACGPSYYEQNRDIVPPNISTFVHTLISSTIWAKLWKISFIPYVWPQAVFQETPCPWAPLYLWGIPAQIGRLLGRPRSEDQEFSSHLTQVSIP